MFASWIQKYRAGKAQKAQAGRLYQAALQATIDPQLYQTYQLADRFETRFDVLALHLFLMLEALEKSGPGDAANLQRLVLEAAMRDLEDT
ncbi:MAG: ubiquinol-cytochrome C chaperone family protein, partial [Pseudomonadota bacterium]